MNNAKLTLMIVLMASVTAAVSARAEVVQNRINAENLIVHVSDESWQPEGFRNGTVVPAAYQHSPAIVIDGRDNEKEWLAAREIEVTRVVAVGREASSRLQACARLSSPESARIASATP